MEKRLSFSIKKQGLFKVYDSQGKLQHYEFYNNNQMMYKGMYDSLNLKSGEWTFFDKKNMSINTGYYTSNKKDKTWTYYYINGSIQQKLINTLGKPTGEWTFIGGIITINFGEKSNMKNLRLMV